MKAGELKQYITFQSVTRARNSFQEMVDTWVDSFSVWAQISPNSGRRYFEAKQANSEAEGIIRIRYRSDIVPATMRVTYGGRYFKILSVVCPVENRRELHLYYKEELD